MPQTTIQVRVPFPDVDSSGRIHFSAIPRYMEIAEHELMREIGFPYVATLKYLALPRVHISCDYRAAISFDDLLTIEARVEHVGRASWTVAFTVRKEEGKVAAEGRMTIVAMDPQTEQSRPLPTDLRAALLNA